MYGFQRHSDGRCWTVIGGNGTFTHLDFTDERTLLATAIAGRPSDSVPSAREQGNGVLGAEPEHNGH